MAELRGRPQSRKTAAHDEPARRVARARGHILDGEVSLSPVKGVAGMAAASRLGREGRRGVVVPSGGRSVLVTGATGVFGRVIVFRLAGAGWT